MNNAHLRFERIFRKVSFQAGEWSLNWTSWEKGSDPKGIRKEWLGKKWHSSFCVLYIACLTDERVRGKKKPFIAKPSLEYGSRCLPNYRFTFQDTQWSTVTRSCSAPRLYRVIIFHLFFLCYFFVTIFCDKTMLTFHSYDFEYVLQKSWPAWARQSLALAPEWDCLLFV